MQTETVLMIKMQTLYERNIFNIFKLKQKYIYEVQKFIK